MSSNFYVTLGMKSIKENGILPKEEKIIEKLKDLNIFEDKKDTDIFQSQVEVSWKNCTEDMKKISLEYKDIIFSLICETGEEWIEYYFNGKTHIGDSWKEYEPFDINKLK